MERLTFGFGRDPEHRVARAAIAAAFAPASLWPSTGDADIDKLFQQPLDDGEVAAATADAPVDDPSDEASLADLRLVDDDAPPPPTMAPDASDASDSSEESESDRSAHESMLPDADDPLLEREASAVARLRATGVARPLDPGPVPPDVVGPMRRVLARHAPPPPPPAAVAPAGRKRAAPAAATEGAAAVTPPPAKRQRTKKTAAVAAAAAPVPAAPVVLPAAPVATVPLTLANVLRQYPDAVALGLVEAVAQPDAVEAELRHAIETLGGTAARIAGGTQPALERQLRALNAGQSLAAEARKSQTTGTLVRAYAATLRLLNPALRDAWLPSATATEAD